MRNIEIKSSTVGQHHAQIIRDNVGAAASFVKGHAEATGLGATTGYVVGFLHGLFGSSKPEGTKLPNV